MSVISSDLRIGNYLQNNMGDIVCVRQIYGNSIICDVLFVDKWDDSHFLSLQEVYPIALDGDTLVRLGFKKGKCKWGDDYILVRNDLDVYFVIEHWTDTDEDSKWKNHWHFKYTFKETFKLQYIHEVQNLLYGLGKEELIYKLPNEK